MNAIIHNAQRTTQIGAEDIAKTGYHEPHLILGTVGRINLISPDDGKTVLQTIDMIQKKKEAWAELLPKLQELGIDTSLPFMQKPFECSINDNVGIKWDKEGVTVSAWVVDLGSLNYTVSSYTMFQSDAIPTRATNTNLICVGYKIVGNHWDDQDMAIYTQNLSSRLWIRNRAKTTPAELKTALQGQHLIYALATPIRIPFRDSNLNLNFSNVHPESLLALDDIDGQRMTRIDVTYRDEADGRYRDTDIRWSEEWLAAHPGQFPQSLQAVMTGMGWKADYPALFKMYQELNNLKAEIQALKSN